MATQKFNIYSEIQCYVDTETNVGTRDTFTVNVNENDPKITISIIEEENDGEKNEAHYLFYGDTFQKIVDWLKTKSVIK